MIKVGAEVHSENSFVQYEKMAPAEVRKRQVGPHHHSHRDHHDHYQDHHDHPDHDQDHDQECYHDIDHAHLGASRGDICVPNVARSSEGVCKKL